MTRHLACGGSPEYVPHTAAMIHSVREHTAGRLHVHYLHGPGLPTGVRRLLAEMVNDDLTALTLLEVGDERIAGLPEMESIPATMWYRTFLPELLPDIGAVLYLDGDTIAVDSLEPLWSTDLATHHVAAVTNVWEWWNADYPASLGLTRPDRYFNSGVLLMDLEQMRRDAVTSELIAYARTAEHLPWGDQDALNVVLEGRRLELHPRWNVMNSVLEFPEVPDIFGAEATAEARRAPGIRHFEGPERNKPWHYLCNREGRNAYLRHRKATPWPRVRREGVTVRNIGYRALRGVRRGLPLSA